ncbi:MAG: hypothetical protein M3011_12530, partial [Actinomycetota bacterium]|nr:hypothetical protein [Actinomycetota bacterium]
MADDDRLLELLGRALAPEPAQPSPDRVTAVRLLAEQGSGALTRRQGPASRPAVRHGSRLGRRGWLAAGVSIAAAAVVIAMVALPNLISSGHEGVPAVARLRVALMSGNAVAVARADANLLRHSDTIAGPDRNDAVAAHVEAIQFLRAHPSADAAAELPPPSTVAPGSESAPAPATVAPTPDPVSGTDQP